MITQETLLGADGRAKLLAGAQKLAEAVAVTLGAKGRNVIIDRGEGQIPHITKDGVTVARAITPTDPIQAMGSRILLDAANKTVFAAGDGTTTATVLAYDMIASGFEDMDNKDANATQIKTGIEKAIKIAVEKIQELARPVDNDTVLRQIATISANNDETIGKIVSDAIIAVGKNGGVTVETSRDSETRIRKVEGLEFDGGWKSPLFITNTVKGECVLQNTYVLMYDAPITRVQEIIAVAEHCVKEKKSLLLIAEDVETEALATLLSNHHSKQLPSCAIAFGRIMFGVFDDIAAVTGAKIVSKERGDKLEKMGIQSLGYARKVIIGSGKTTIYDGGGDKEVIQSRIAEVQTKLEETPDGYVKENLKTRLAKLSNGVAIIEVGGMSQVEINEKKDRIDDAINATRAANEEGFVAGGGTTFLQCIEAVNSGNYIGDEIIGAKIVAYALEEPFHIILENAGIEIVDFVKVEGNTKGMLSQPYGIGINVNTGKTVDMFESGIIDPAKVLRVALENAGSVAGTFITTECVVYNIPDPLLG